MNRKILVELLGKGDATELEILNAFADAYLKRPDKTWIGFNPLLIDGVPIDPDMLDRSIGSVEGEHCAACCSDEEAVHEYAKTIAMGLLLTEGSHG